MASVPVPGAMPSDVTPTLVARQRFRGGRAADSTPVPLAVVHPHVAWMEWL